MKILFIGTYAPGSRPHHFDRAVANPHRPGLAVCQTTTAFDVIGPVDETIVETVRFAGRAEMDARVERADRAFATWRRVAPGDRARLLRRFADAVDADVETLAGLEVRNAGHTIGNARWEVGNVRDVLGYYAAAPERLAGRQIPVAGGIDVTFHEPMGVVGVIVPWNFPMPLAAWGFAPAPAAGNTVIVKPAQYTPLTVLRLEQLALEAGLPPDVFQVVLGPGAEAGEHLVGHPLVRKIVFTGSTAVGKQIMRLCLRRRRPGACRGHRADGGVRQLRPGLLLQVPGAGAAQCLRAVHGAA